MSLTDLRKELKNLRKEAMPTPVSRMKKTEVATELERLRGLGRGSTKKVEESAPVEKVAKKVVEKKEEKPKAPKVEKPKKEEAPKEEKPKDEKHIPTKYIKGSQEARDRMAMIRSMKGKKEQKE